MGPARPHVGQESGRKLAFFSSRPANAWTARPARCPSPEGCARDRQGCGRRGPSWRPAPDAVLVRRWARPGAPLAGRPAGPGMDTGRGGLSRCSPRRRGRFPGTCPPPLRGWVEWPTRCRWPALGCGRRAARARGSEAVQRLAPVRAACVSNQCLSANPGRTVSAAAASGGLLMVASDVVLFLRLPHLIERPDNPATLLIAERRVPFTITEFDDAGLHGSSPRLLHK